MAEDYICAWANKTICCLKKQNKKTTLMEL